MYKFKRIKVEGWDYFVATPKLTEEHHVSFPVAGITPVNRYQLLLFVDSPTVVRLDNPEISQTMQPGQTSMDFNVEVFPKDSLWIEHPVEDGAKRFCLAPAGPMRKWAREVVGLAEGQELTLQDNQIAILLLGTAMLEGINSIPGDFAKGGELITPTSAIRVLVAQ